MASLRSARPIALGVVLLFLATGLLGPLIAPEDGIAVHLGHTLSGPSSAHLLGTDHLGRDELSRMLLAARSTLEILGFVLGTALVLGVLVGVLAGWVGGLVDTLLMRVVDVMIGLPQFVLALVLLGTLGAGVRGVMVALAAGAWMGFARLVRTEVMVLRREPMVQALRLLGASGPRILTRHLLAALARPVLVLLSTEAGMTVLNIATLSFLGVGVVPPTPEWGGMVVEARPYLGTDPRLFLLPAAAIALVVAALNLLAEGPSAPTPWSGRAPRRAATPPARQPTGGPLLAVHGLTVELDSPGGGRTRVLDEVSFGVRRGETVALVGGSGSGKTIATSSLLGLTPQGVGATVAGSATLRGRELLGLAEHALRGIRGSQVALVPQDLSRALNPLRRVGPQIAEAARLHRGLSRPEAARHGRELLGLVGIRDPGRVYDQRPDQLSGGMRQRVLIAAALAGQPQVLIADEPTSALDITVQARLLRLLARLRDELDLALILITHDFGVVAELADRVVVLDRGRVVEHGPTPTVLPPATTRPPTLPWSSYEAPPSGSVWAGARSSRWTRSI